MDAPTEVLIKNFNFDSIFSRGNLRAGLNYVGLAEFRVR